VKAEEKNDDGTSELPGIFLSERKYLIKFDVDDMMAGFSCSENRVRRVRL
jgi:hypothetical protein